MMRNKKFYIISILVVFLFLVFKTYADQNSRVNVKNEALAVFQNRQDWKTLPPDFLNQLAIKLKTADSALEFVLLCEKTGILKENIKPILETVNDNNEVAILLVSNSIVSCGNKMIYEKQYSLAKRLLQISILIEPRNYPAWESMAGVSLNINDCKNAIFWANKVLSFKPDKNSENIVERNLAKAISQDKQEVDNEMRQIIETCKH
jgi:hypothetical protein